MGDESWLTPWHGVAMKTHEGFILVKRTHAEALGAKIVKTADGRPSHFDLTLTTSSATQRETSKELPL